MKFPSTLYYNNSHKKKRSQWSQTGALTLQVFQYLLWTPEDVSTKTKENKNGQMVINEREPQFLKRSVKHCGCPLCW